MTKRNRKIVEDVLDATRKMLSYDVGETIEGLAHKLGKPTSEILKLNSNENFFVPLGFLRKSLRQAVEEIDPRIYPRDEIKVLEQILAENIGVSPTNIVLGTGSDQLIDLTSRIFLNRGDRALAISPTFSIYKRCTLVQRASYKPVSLRKDFSLDLNGILAEMSPRTKIVFLCSPNNPTANTFSREQIGYLAESFEGIIAIDEAYIDFSGNSIIDLIEEYNNLVLFRTFSKVFGLAGLRVGYLVSNEYLAKPIKERIQMPYSISLVALKTIINIFDHLNVINRTIEEIKTARANLIEGINGIKGIKAFNSETNFVLFQTQKDSDEVFRDLLLMGIIVRNIGRVAGHKNCLRVSVAPSEMMGKFLTALEDASK